MTVKQIYTKYKIPPNLQKHLLRVAALSQVLVENWKEKNLDKESITLACLFHDMANIIKFDFTKPQLFKEEESRADYWQRAQASVIKKYGSNIHLATLKMSQETGLSNKALRLIKDLEWDKTLKILEEENFVSAICTYSDMRIGPFGILSLKERIKNLQSRNKSHDFTLIIKAANLLQETLQKRISINVNSITESQLNERFADLLKLEVI